MSGRARIIRIALATTALVVLGTCAAWGTWSTSGGGDNDTGTSDFDPASIDAPASSSGASTITWTAQASIDDDPSAGTVSYRVQRAQGTGAFANIASGPCSGDLPRPTTNCTDTVATTATFRYRVVAALATWTATSAEESVAVNTDTTGPTVTLARVTTTPTNATALQWKATFNESVTGVNAADFALATTGAVTGSAITSVTGSGTTYTVSVNAGSGDGTIGLNLQDDDSIRDGAGNPLGGPGTGNGAATGPVITVDRTAPTLTATAMNDTNANGKINTVTLTSSESIAATPATSAFTLANVPSAATLSTISRSSATIKLNLTEGAGATDTAVGAFTVALAASSTGVRDAAGNQASFSATAPSDKSKPVLLSVTDTNGSVDGQMQTGDTMTFAFSEPLKAASVATAPALTLTRPSTGNATLAVPGQLYTTTSLGQAGYLSATGKAVYAGSTTLSGSTVKLTVGACSSGCTLMTAPSTGASVVVRPSTSLTDTAANAAKSTTYTWDSVKVF